MVKHTKNRNHPEGSKAPMVDEIDAATIGGDEQFEDYCFNHVNLTEK